MMIVCPTCTTSYDVSAASLGPQGRSVRCVKCRTVWHADPTAEPVMAEAAMGPEPADWGDADDPSDQADDRTDGRRPEEPLGDALLDPGARALAMDRDEPDTGAKLDDHESPPIAPDDGPHFPVVDVETRAARRIDRKSRDRRRGKPILTVSILVMAGLLGGILGWRANIVRLLPQTGGLFRLIGLPVNLRGLEFSDVVSTHEIVDGATVLVIEGKITNPTQQPRDVPRIRLALLNARGAEIYAWTTVPAKPVLAPGAVETVQTRLASPPGDGRAITMRFLNRHDAASGMK